MPRERDDSRLRPRKLQLERVGWGWPPALTSLDGRRVHAPAAGPALGRLATDNAGQAGQHRLRREILKDARAMLFLPVVTVHNVVRVYAPTAAPEVELHRCVLFHDSPHIHRQGGDNITRGQVEGPDSRRFVFAERDVGRSLSGLLFARVGHAPTASCSRCAKHLFHVSSENIPRADRMMLPWVSGVTQWKLERPPREGRGGSLSSSLAVRCRCKRD